MMIKLRQLRTLEMWKMFISVFINYKLIFNLPCECEYSFCVGQIFVAKLGPLILHTLINDC